MKTMKTLKLFLLALLVSCAGLAAAKLPPLSDEQKAKAAEAKAKADATVKNDAELLGKYQDMVAATYIAQQKKLGKTVTPTPIAPPPAPAAAVVAAAPAPAKKP